MIQDCIRMLSVILCGNERKNIKITPDRDAYDITEFIVQIFGKCEIDEVHCKAKLKPLKKLPKGTVFITVHHASKELFMLLAGVVTQLDLSACFEETEPYITPEEFRNMSEVTQGQLQFAFDGKKIYLSSLLSIENPLFEKCKIPAFSAGLCLGAVLALCATEIRKYNPRRNKLVTFTVNSLLEEGAVIENLETRGYPIINSMRKQRLILKTDKNK